MVKDSLPSDKTESRKSRVKAHNTHVAAEQKRPGQPKRSNAANQYR